MHDATQTKGLQIQFSYVCGNLVELCIFGAWSYILVLYCKIQKEDKWNIFFLINKLLGYIVLIYFKLN